MAQVRVMASDPEQARLVADVVARLLQLSPEVHLGDVSEVPNRRDGGLRVFLEVVPAAPGPTTVVRVDREEDGTRPPPRVTRGGRGRRELS